MSNFGPMLSIHGDDGPQSGVANHERSGEIERGNERTSSPQLVDRIATPGHLLAPGTEVAERFRIVSRIGQGGMGAVYRAEQLGMGRNVALKVILNRTDRSAREAAMLFIREARAASRINSPHVVRILDFGSDDSGLLYLAMELLEGETLAHRLARQGNLSWPEAVAVAHQTARALMVAHEAGVIHRDLKPDNIYLVTDDSNAGLVKVLDFGIAQVSSDTEFRSVRTTFVGTPLYMSPEATSQRPVGPSADLYSLGVLMFETITGRPPFESRDIHDLMARHRLSTPPRINELRPELGVPTALDEIVFHMLQKRPEHRPPSARVLADSLRPWLGPSISAPPPAPSMSVCDPAAAARTTEIELPLGRRAPSTWPWWLGVAILIAIVVVIMTMR